MPSQIAAQMYTLRAFTKTPADLAKTLAHVKKIGYEAVQLSGHGPIDPNELATMVKNEGLVCCATHVQLDRLKNEPQKIIDEQKLLNCQYTAIGGYFPKENLSAQLWSTFASDFNEVAKKFAGSGVHLGYHNHSHELVKYDGKTALEIILDKFNPSIWMEIDTFWIAGGGADPAAWIDKVKGRIPCVHLKDMLVRNDRSQYMAEVGVGNLNWPRILESCRNAGVKWYIVEQDDCYRDAFDSLQTSLENLRTMGVQ